MSAVTSGVAYTFLSFFKGKVDGLTVMMHFSTFSAIASIPFMLKDFVVPSFKQAVLLLLIGVFGSLGQAFITYAYRFAPASEISIYNYSGIIFSMILGFFILGEPVKFTSVIVFQGRLFQFLCHDVCCKQSRHCHQQCKNALTYFLCIHSPCHCSCYSSSFFPASLLFLSG